jgi:hypothetical protein
MATTLSFGYIQPQNGDPGSIWFPALNDDIQQLNDHDHDGSNSAQLSSSNLLNGAVVILAAAWISNGTGSFYQDVTCPAGYNMDDYSISVRINGSFIIYPSMTRLTATTFRIFTLDNSLAYRAVFS